MRHLLILFSILVASHAVLAQNDEKEKMREQFAANFSNLRIPAEWEETNVLVMVWKNYFDAIGKIASAAQEVGNVLLICSDSLEVKKYFRFKSLQTKHLHFLQTDFNSVWIRDYGPVNIYQAGTDSLALIDFLYNRKRLDDDLIPLQLALLNDVQLLQISTPQAGLVQIGGNFMSNGLGTAMSSRLVLRENKHMREYELRALFSKYMGINEYILFDTLPYDCIHHLDMHMKLIDEETLMVGAFPNELGDQLTIDKNIRYFKQNYLTAYENPYKIVQIPMPADYGRFADSTGWADYLTYTNSLFFNSIVFVPTYGISTDKMALDIYKKHFPGYKIIGINVEEPISDGGAIHCFTYTLAAKKSENIWFAKPDYMSSNDSILKLAAYVNSLSLIDSLTIFYKSENEKTFKNCNLIPERKNTGWYDIELAIPTSDLSINYYLMAINVNHEIIKAPITSPKAYYTILRTKQSIDSLQFTTDTLQFHEGIFKLNNFLKQPNKQFLYHWASLENYEIKKNNSIEASIRLTAGKAGKVYGFRLTVSDGNKLLYKNLYVKCLH